MKIALAGNPNSGKTTMYNALTGANEKVGNWAGVTVEKKEHSLKKTLNSTSEEIIIVDLPGAYSMSPFTSEEAVTKDYIENEKPDVIINIVDATNLSRSLFFTTQLLELNIPVAIALNKSDLNVKKHNKINAELLSEKLNCPVIETISTTADGVKAIIEAAVKIVSGTQVAPYIQENVDLSKKSDVKAADKKRFQFVKAVVAAVEERKTFTHNRNVQDKIDAVITNKWVGLPIFAVVMFLVLWISQYGPGVWVADWLVGLLEAGQSYLSELFTDANPFLAALLVDGVVGGVIAVVGFLPLVMVMYFLIALLEDCGYMARASVVLDPIFKKVGLSGKSIIPFVITTGCAVPGIMACRTIRNEQERRVTAMLSPFMPCGAKLPVIALISGVFFGDAKWIGPVMYFLGIALIFFGALLVNKVSGYKARKSYFIIELPEYKAPSLVRAFKSMCSRGWAYVVKAATVILVCNTAVQIMQTFSWNLQVAENADASILATIASPFSYIFFPVVGVISWQLAASTITGFIAKENVVGTLAVCFSITNFINVDEFTLEGGASQVASVLGLAPAAAMAFLILNLYSPPCFAALAAMNSEMKSAKWFWSGIALQVATAFSLGFIVYQAGTLISTGALGNGFVYGLIAVLIFAAIVVALIIKNNKKVITVGKAKDVIFK
jgi:ferrous iron transport protein B